MSLQLNIAAELRARFERAVEGLREDLYSVKYVGQPGPGIHAWRVESEHSPAPYEVQYRAGDGWSCDCTDFFRRSGKLGLCKHCIVVWLGATLQRRARGTSIPTLLADAQQVESLWLKLAKSYGLSDADALTATAAEADSRAEPATEAESPEPVPQSDEETVEGEDETVTNPAPAQPWAVAWTPAVASALRDPFPSRLVGWKAQTLNRAKTRALAVAYVDARTVAARLDKVVGPVGWSDSYRVVRESPNGLEVECCLTVLGVAKSDVGVGEDAKAAYSDAFKRAAVKHGIARYLYGLPKVWVDYDDQTKQLRQQPQLPEWAVPEAERRPGTGRPGGTTPAPSNGTPARSQNGRASTTRGANGHRQPARAAAPARR